MFYQVGLWALAEALPGLNKRGKAQREERVREGWSRQFAGSLPARFLRLTNLRHVLSITPLLESKVQTQLSFPSENQVTTCFHPLTDMPLYGGCKSALLMSAVPLYTSGKGRISIAAYKCLALMKNSPQRSESMVQLPVPITYLRPRASLEPCKCES